MKKILPLLTFLLLSCTLAAQTTINGRIEDIDGKSIQFGSVYVDKTNIGTSVNADGQFKLTIPKGTHTLSVKAIGYKAKSTLISDHYTGLLTIQLEREDFAIEDVVINVSQDPAIKIMRNAINKRKFHLTEVSAFSTEVYIKGVQRMLNMPNKFFGVDVRKEASQLGLDSNGRGILYLSESQSIYSFQAPNNVHEEMISSKVSGSNRAFSFNRASDLNFNLYENSLNLRGISLRPLVSPLAENAFFYYNYKYLGVSEENGYTVFKIKVIPKRNSDPVFRGTIYILNDSWRLYDADLVLSKEVNLNFIDSLKVKQQYTPVKDDVWMISSLRLDFNGGLLGFKFEGNFDAIFNNYTLHATKTKREFREVSKVNADANKKDASFWEENRPIPLTEEEQNDYVKKAALASKRESKPYLDSLDREQNKFKPKKLLFSGYRITNRWEKTSYNLSSIRDALFYNTVEGVGLNYNFGYSKRIDSVTNKYLRLAGKLRYGFSSEKFYPMASATIPFNKFNLNLSAGADVLDLNNRTSQSLLGNTLNSLIYETNYLKLYEKKFAFASVTGRIAGGLTGSFFTEYAWRASLTNTTDYKWKDWPNRAFTSNNPFTPQLDLPLFANSKSFKMGATLSYNFSNKYVSYPSGRFYIASKFPTLSVGFIKAIPNVFDSDVDYELIQGSVSKQNIPLGFYGNLSLMVGAGKFLKNNKIIYPDLAHFNGNQSTVFESATNAFLFLDLYRSSTAKSYIEVHAEHNFSGFFLNKIPLIRKLKLEELAGVNYLSTPGQHNYMEAYFGVTHLTGFKILYGYGFESGKKIDHGIRLSLRL